MGNARCAAHSGSVCSPRAEALVLCASKDGDGCGKVRETCKLSSLTRIFASVFVAPATAPNTHKYFL